MLVQLSPFCTSWQPSPDWLLPGDSVSGKSRKEGSTFQLSRFFFLFLFYHGKLCRSRIWVEISAAARMIDEKPPLRRKQPPQNFFKAENGRITPTMWFLSQNDATVDISTKTTYLSIFSFFRKCQVVVFFFRTTKWTEEFILLQRWVETEQAKKWMVF